jgi:hypothetical protein
MQIEVKFLKRFNYHQNEWIIIKIFSSVFWLFSMYKITNEYLYQPFPEGICKFLNCSFFSNQPTSIIVLLFSVVACVGYIFNRYTLVSLIYMTICSLIFLSLERSNGIYDRQELWTMIFGAQLYGIIRYKWKKDFFKTHSISEHDIAIFYSIQMIAVAYTIAGITKLQTSGIYWVIDSPNVVLQLKKITEQINIEFGFKQLQQYSLLIQKTLSPLVIQILFFISLLIEVFAFLMCYSRKFSYYYGWLLFMLHMGIFMMMFVIIPIYLFVILFFLLGFPKQIIRLGRKLAPDFYLFK